MDKPTKGPLGEVKDLISDLNEISKTSKVKYKHPYSDLGFKDFVTALTGIPIIGYNYTPGTYKATPKSLPFAPIHGQIMDKLEDHTIDRLLVLVARQHAKSTIVTQLYPVWEILRDPDIRIMIISDSKGVSTASISRIGQYLKKLGVDFRKDKEEEKTVEGRKDEGLLERDPTLMAFSKDSKLSGRHCDIAILDDCIVLENSYTQIQRAKLEEWINSQVSQVFEAQGRFIVTGVRWRHADYHGILADPMQHPEFGPPNDPTRGRVIAPACTKDYQNVIWPEKWSEQLLRERERQIGVLSFACQFRLDPSGMEGGLFKLDWIFGDGSSEYQQLPNINYNVLGVDPSLGQGQNFFAMCLGGVGDGPNGKALYVKGFYKMNIPTGQQPDVVVKMALQEKVTNIGIEDTGYQIALENGVKEKLRENGINIRVEGFKGPVKKEIRLQELSYPLLNGKVRFPSDYITNDKGEVIQKRAFPWKRDFIEEYATFPTGQYDDMLDSLYYSFKISKIFSGPKPMSGWEPLIVVGDAVKVDLGN